MISGFSEWATSAQLIETAGLEQLKGATLAIEADDFINTLLGTTPTTEPLLPALGGLPFALETQVRSVLNHCKEHEIKPVFVFNGLSANGQETKLQKALKASQGISSAWDFYTASDPEKAVAEFGKSGIFDADNIYRYFQSFFRREKVDFLVAPYSACAQLAIMEGTDFADAVLGSSEILMFNVDKVVLKVDWEAASFAWVVRRSCMDKLGVTSTSQFVDACLLAGSSFLPTLPHLEQDVPLTPRPPRIQAAADLLKRTNQDGNSICLQYQDDPAMQSPSYLERYQKAYLSVKHHVVLTPDGKVECLSKDSVPSDVHAFIGQRLPDEVYAYLSRGVIGPRVLTWRTAGEIVESPPLDGGMSAAYHELVRDGLVPLRSSALALLSYSLHRFYQHTDVTLRLWFNEDAPKALNISSTDDPKGTISNWNVRSKAIQGKASSTDPSTVAFALTTLQDISFAEDSKKSAPGKNFTPLRHQDEIRANALWRFLQLRGFVGPDHRLTALGTSLQSTLAGIPDPEFEEPVVLSLEMLRLNLLNANSMFHTYGGAPMRGSDIDKRNTLLVSRVACLLRLRHKDIGYTGPLSRHLLAYQCMISAVRGSLRDLLEMSLCTMLINGHVARDLPPQELVDVSFSLPFVRDTDCALGIAVKSYLDELTTHDKPTSQEARQSVMESGMRAWFPHAVDLPGDLQRAFALWDAVFKLVQNVPTTVVSDKDRKLWEEVNVWLAERR